MLFGFDNLKELYKETMEDIQDEKKQLVSQLSEIVSHIDKNVAGMGKILKIYSDFSASLNKKEFNKAIDLLRANGFDNLDDLNQNGANFCKRSRIS